MISCFVDAIMRKLASRLGCIIRTRVDKYVMSTAPLVVLALNILLRNWTRQIRTALILPKGRSQPMITQKREEMSKNKFVDW